MLYEVITEKQVWPGKLHCFPARFGTVEGPDVAIRFEDGGDDFENKRVIVDDEYLERLAHDGFGSRFDGELAWAVVSWQVSSAHR